MKRVGFVVKLGHPEARAIARDLVPWLATRGFEAVLGNEAEAEAAGASFVADQDLARGVDLIVCLGGDGTLLHASNLIGDAATPVLGINLGRLGFLVPFDPSEARWAVEQALDGKLELEERMRLRVRLVRPDNDTLEKLCLNDAVISQGAMARLIEVQASLEDDRITVYRADGLIVSTPTGSTAYNLAAGGPILSPQVAAMAITPICPHTLTNRPLVVPASSRVVIQLVGHSTSVNLTVDGQWAWPLAVGDRVEIQQSDAPLRLYRSDKSYFEILRDKLRWGVRES